jgi:hypothetical protein
MPNLAPEQVLQYGVELLKTGFVWSAVGRRGAGSTCHCEATDLQPVGDALAECVRALAPAGDGGHTLVLGAFVTGLLLGGLFTCAIGACAQQRPSKGAAPAAPESVVSGRPRRTGGRSLGNLTGIVDSVHFQTS